MPSILTPRRALRLLASAAVLAGLVACNDVAAPDEGDHADEIVAMRLTVAGTAGSATYRLTDGGVLTPSPLRLPVGVASVTVDFLDEQDAVLDDVPASEYEIQFANLPTGLAFARTGAFTGAFTGTASGTGTMQIQLFHLEEQHPDLGPYFLPTVVAP